MHTTTTKTQGALSWIAGHILVGLGGDMGETVEEVWFDACAKRVMLMLLYS